MLPCRPYRRDTVRCHRHAADDPAIGQPIEARKPTRRAAEKAEESSQKKLPAGLEPKTVVNARRMLHRAWEEFTSWGWAKPNVVVDAHPTRVPARGARYGQSASCRPSCPVTVLDNRALRDAGPSITLTPGDRVNLLAREQAAKSA